MSIIRTIKHRLGLSVTPANNFVWDASADNGTMKLARESGQDIMTVDAAGKVAFPQMAQSLTENGYVKLPGGLIIQWGKQATNGDVIFTYPLVFSGLLSLALSVEYTASSGSEAVIASVREVTNSGFIGQARYINGTAGPAAVPTTCSIRYIAIGY